MTHAERSPDPSRLHTLDDLAQAFMKLRRRGARKGQVHLSVRDLGRRTNKAPSTLDAYLRGIRLPPADVYEDMLRALGIPVASSARGWTPGSGSPTGYQRGAHRPECALSQAEGSRSSTSARRSSTASWGSGTARTRSSVSSPETSAGCRSPTYGSTRKTPT
ncbi:helix-turn-helix domain-containing protein [Phytohabitans flavus]|uniref:helix-turn-helix domain-containing protein n=1 Tax=Phytohabitans flavus TaxID=1076124 RepID=UPI00362C412A